MEFLEKIDWEVLNSYIDNGYISISKHYEYDIWVLNYTPKTHIKQYWDLYTISCRGMVIDEKGKILARPFKRFANYEEHHDIETINDRKKCEVFEKIDGSLIVLFKYERMNKWIVTTRGSFISEQAIKAKEMISRGSLNILDKDYTYLFEIIYKKNRIVVDYGDVDDIILLSRIKTDDGKETTHIDIVIKYSNYFNVVKKYNILFNTLHELKNMKRENHEGFVVKYEDGLRVKVVHEEYVKLHKILFNISNKTIWTYLKNGNCFKEVYGRVTKELEQWIKNNVKELKDEYFIIERNALKEFLKIYYTDEIIDRREFALIAQKSKYRAILFKIYDNDMYDKIIWNMIKPINIIYYN